MLQFVQRQVCLGIGGVEQPGEVAQHDLPQLLACDDHLGGGVMPALRCVIRQPVQQRRQQPVTAADGRLFGERAIVLHGRRAHSSFAVNVSSRM
ncbi:hypothetical protein SDC9_156289 [bioreactor metagenome]|uniref:Uncharacterized protein n=1 Tax=bioreactor metagenome TaxID=1076179 RepID=A0A645F404_9ZZZZ